MHDSSQSGITEFSSDREAETINMLMRIGHKLEYRRANGYFGWTLSCNRPNDLASNSMYRIRENADGNTPL